MGGMGDHLKAEMLKIYSTWNKLLHSSPFHVSFYQFPFRVPKRSIDKEIKSCFYKSNMYNQNQSGRKYTPAEITPLLVRLLAAGS